MLIGREGLEDGKIKGGEIEGGEIGNNEIKEGEEDIGIINYKEFFLNYTDCCAISIYSANLIIDRAAIETANTY
jgi:hypothetical protein